MTLEKLKKLADEGLITDVTLFQAIEAGDISVDDIDEKYLVENGYITMVGVTIPADDEGEEPGEGDDNPDTPDTPEEPEPEPKDPAEYAQEVTAALKAGGDVKLEQPLVLEKGILTLTSATPTTLDLNGQELEVQEGGTYGDTCQISNGATVTIKNGELKPAGKASQANQSATVLVKTAAGGNVTLENVKVTGFYPVYLNSTNTASSVEILSGEYSSVQDGNATIYVGKGSTGSTTGGKITIRGGVFGIPGHTSDFLLNVEDVLRKQEGKEPRDFLVVYGGEFYNFNPADNVAEGAHTNFVADSYVAGYYEKDGDKIYVVHEEGNLPETTEDGLTINWPSKSADEVEPVA